MNTFLTSPSTGREPTRSPSIAAIRVLHGTFVIVAADGANVEFFVKARS